MKAARRAPETSICSVDTPLGRMLAAAEGDCLVGLWFEGQKHFPETTGWVTRKGHPAFAWLHPYLKCYFGGTVGNHDFPLAPRGSALEQVVWEIVRDVPYGRTVTPAFVLKEAQTSRNARHATREQIEEAIDRNPIAILIPSHRVVGSLSKLGGYPAGVERKQALLRIEGVPGVASPSCCGSAPRAPFPVSVTVVAEP